MGMRLKQSGITWHQVGDEVVVLDLDGSAYFRTNGSGSVLWAMLSEPRSADELRAELVERYGIDEQRAAADVDAFLEQLRGHELLEQER